MQRFTVLAASLILGLGLLIPTSVEAQTSFEIGPRLGIPVGDVSDRGGSLFLGADARISGQALPVVLNPSVDFYLVDDVSGTSAGQSVFAVDMNALYEFGVENQVFTPYAGGGVGITRFSADTEVSGLGSETTEVGLNIVGGARFPLGNLEPFAQLNATLGGDLERFGITGGLLFSL